MRDHLCIANPKALSDDPPTPMDIKVQAKIAERYKQYDQRQTGS